MPLHYHFLPVLGSESETHSTIVFVFGLEKTPTDFNEKAPPFIHSAQMYSLLARPNSQRITGIRMRHKAVAVEWLRMNRRNLFPGSV